MQLARIKYNKSNYKNKMIIKWTTNTKRYNINKVDVKRWMEKVGSGKRSQPTRANQHGIEKNKFLK